MQHLLVWKPLVAAGINNTAVSSYQDLKTFSWPAVDDEPAPLWLIRPRWPLTSLISLFSWETFRELSRDLTRKIWLTDHIHLLYRNKTKDECCLLRADQSRNRFCSDRREESSEIIFLNSGIKSRFIFSPVYQPDCSSDRRRWPPVSGVSVLYRRLLTGAGGEMDFTQPSSPNKCWQSMFLQNHR